MALCLMGRPENWMTARQYLPYVRNYYEFDIESVPEETIKKAKVMADDPDLQIPGVATASKVALELAVWAHKNIELWYILRAWRERDLPRKDPPRIEPKPELTFAELVQARKDEVRDSIRKLTRNAVKEITDQDKPHQSIVNLLNILMVLLGEENTWVRARTVL